MTMDSPIMSPHDVDPRESTSLSVALPFWDYASSGLTKIVNIGEGSETFNERPDRFRSVTINSR